MDSTPFLISWNITKRCNLKCSHCYLNASELEHGEGELSTGDAMKVIDEIASVNPQAMLIFTGGEPLLRNDWRELTSYAAGKGFTVVMGTNGTLIDDLLAKDMISHGIKGVGISLDSILALHTMTGSEVWRAHGKGQYLP